MNNNVNNNISFKAKPGPRLLKQINKELNFNPQKTQQFARLFEDVYAKNTDINTIIDIDKNKNFIFSNTLFPNIKYLQKNQMNIQKSLVDSLLNICIKTIRTGESSLFRNIIAKEIKNGRTFEKLRNIAQTHNLKKSFLEDLSLAEKILEENPESKLHNHEFDIMWMKIKNEELRKLSSSNLLEILAKLNT